jgi:hypothetical protein
LVDKPPGPLFKDYQTWQEAKKEIRAIQSKRERRGYRVTEG